MTAYNHSLQTLQKSDDDKLRLAELHKLTADNHIDNIKTADALKQATREVAKELGRHKEMTGNDLRTLHGLVCEVQQQVKSLSGIAYKHARYLEDVPRPIRARLALEEAPPEDSANGAVVSTDEVRVKEKLRKQSGVTTELIVAALRCCDDPFQTLRRAMSQFAAEYDKAIQRAVCEATTSERRVEPDTPTHMRARKPQAGMEETSKAMIIKPVDEMENGTKIGLEDKIRKEDLHKQQLPTPPSSNNNVISDKANDGAERTYDSITPTLTMPLAVRQMPAMVSASLAKLEKDAEVFTWEFLKSQLGGDQWSPGFYFILPSHHSILPSRAYWLLETQHEPFLPPSPGMHGAKLTAFFNDTCPDGEYEAPIEQDYMNAPVFISVDGGKTYRYYGNYSQHRFSDKLDYERLVSAVPEEVKRYWAAQLADPGRPDWVTRQLTEHFWPKPSYDGPILTDSVVNSPNTPATGESGGSGAMLEKRILRALGEYAEELKTWDKEAKMKVKMLTSENIYKAFSNADADEEPGLRLWWEYLQCVDYGQGFFQLLCTHKQRAAGGGTAHAVVNSAQAVNGTSGKNETSGASSAEPITAAQVSKASPAKPATASSAFYTSGKTWNNLNTVKPWEQPIPSTTPKPAEEEKPGEVKSPRAGEQVNKTISNGDEVKKGGGACIRARS